MQTYSQPLPRGPILGWSSFEHMDAPNIASVERLAHTAFTTSGRAAIYQALLQLQLTPGSTVLVPSYHCPTMVAPVLLAKLNVAYFGLRPDGLPNLANIDAATTANARAILVPHYFGLAKSLAEVRQWCNERDIALIEDCAHSYFGDAGERPVGDWGDYATASLSKFLPVPEGGLLASSRHSIKHLALTPQGFRAQLKGWFDMFELATQYKRLSGINKIMAGLFWLKNPHLRSQTTPSANATPSAALPAPDATTLMRDADMARIALAPLAATNALKALLPRGRIITRRQQNFAAYTDYFANVKGARPLFPLPTKAVAPYVFPLWVDDAERVYREIRALALPVFRWDRIWPGTPKLDGDVGPLWSQHVLQLLCHQDLSNADINRTALAILNLLETDSLPAPVANHSKLNDTTMSTHTQVRWENLAASALAQNAQLHQAWEQLNAERGNLPFLASDAIVSALSILGDGTERLLVGYEDTTVVAMFLLSPQGKFQWRTFQPSQIPLGAWVAKAELELLRLTRSLLRGPLGFCLGLSITQIDPLTASRADDAPDTKTLDYIDTGWIDIEGTFEAYWAARGKNLRQNMRKQRAKLAADGVTLTMQVLRNYADMAPAIARYGELESAGWKAQSGTAIHPDNAQGRFYRELLEHASLRGEAAVYQYQFDDRVVAMNLCLLNRGTLVVLKTTYDESIKTLSPAFLLREEELQDIYRQGQIKRMEYFGKVMDWHTKLTDKKRTVYHLTAYRWPFVKKLAQARRRKATASVPDNVPPAGSE